mgnify:CR=1 FL=1
MPEKTLLGIDFGRKKMGTAIGQTITKTAKALKNIKANAGTPDWSQLDAVVNEWEVDGIVVGLPLNMDGSEQAISQQARQFANELKKRYSIPIVLHDERLSTVEAKTIAFTQGGEKACQSDHVDSLAAQIVLESYLNTIT